MLYQARTPASAPASNPLQPVTDSVEARAALVTDIRTLKAMIAIATRRSTLRRFRDCSGAKDIYTSSPTYFAFIMFMFIALIIHNFTHKTADAV